MKFWNKENLKEALGVCQFYNVPDDFTASGIKVWHDSIQNGDIVFLRGPEETKGALVKNILSVKDKISAFICTNYENFKDLNKPVIEVEDFTKALFSLGRYIRRHYKGIVITITGSAGKSTTTKMIYDVLNEYGADANLNLSNTLTAICWNMTTFDINKKYWVIESSIGNGYVSSPDIAIVTNLAPVHLKEGQTIDVMARAKSRIFSTMKAGSCAVLNRETECYEIFENAALEKNLKIITVGERDGVDIKIIPDDGSFVIENKSYKFDNKFVPKHILYDIGLVLAVGLELNLSFDIILQKLADFKYLKGRGDILKINFDGKNITLTDESYNANPLSMKTTIESFGKNYASQKVMFLGDMAEGGDKSKEYHLSLIKPIKNANPSKVILCGREMECVYDVLKDNIECYYFKNIEELLLECTKFINHNDNVFVKASHSIGLYKLVDFLKKSN